MAGDDWLKRNSERIDGLPNKLNSLIVVLLLEILMSHLLALLLLLENFLFWEITKLDHLVQAIQRRGRVISSDRMAMNYHRLHRIRGLWLR